MASEAEDDLELLRELLFEVEIPGHGKFPVGQPSTGRYRGEDYGWDPAFFIHSLVAAGEIETALRMMDGNAVKIKTAGYLPLVTRWDTSQHGFVWKLRTREDPRFTAETQQPLTAQTALFLLRTDASQVNKERLKTWAEAAQTHLDWLVANRRGEGRKLFWVLDPVESGEDSLAVWDEILAEKTPGFLPNDWRIFQASSILNLRYIAMGWDLKKIYQNEHSVIIEPVSLNVFAARELMALQVLWTELGETSLAKKAKRDAAALVSAINNLLWNEKLGAYFPMARFGSGCWAQLTTYSVESLYPLLLPNLVANRVDRLIKLIEKRFLTGSNYLLPVSPVDPKRPSKIFGKVGIWWSGQIWANTNWFFRDGLEHQATKLYGDSAAKALYLSRLIDSDWLKLKSKSGYPEFYHQDGAGGAEQRFFWSCLRRAKFAVEIR